MTWVRRLEKAAYSRLLDFPSTRRLATYVWQGLWSTVQPARTIAFGQVDVFPGMFFGFHDKSPWNVEGSLIAAHSPGPTNLRNGLELPVGRLNPANGEFQRLAATKAWNWQQGAQLQWIDPTGELVFNDFDDDGVPVTRAVGQGGQARVVTEGHIGAVERQSARAALVDLHRLGFVWRDYGFPRDKRQSRMSPAAKEAIWIASLEDSQVEHTLEFEHIEEVLGGLGLSGGSQGISHCSFSPDGSRLAFFHVAVNDGSRRIQLLIYEIEARSVTRVNVARPSHYCWGDSCSIFVTHMERPGDWVCGMFPVEALCSPTWSILMPFGDVHVNYCVAAGALLMDTYPDRYRIQRLFSVKIPDGQPELLFASKIPFSYRGQIRCDFHARWGPNGRVICFDSAHTGVRSLCVMHLPEGDQPGAKMCDGPRYGGYRIA